MAVSSSFYGLIVLLAVMAGILRLVNPGRRSVHQRRRDAQRRFDAAQRRVIIERAGNRCEATLFGYRCRRVDGLEADHIVPWAAGGATDVANGQALCRTHNRMKSNRAPIIGYRRRLEKRRIRY